MQLIYLNRLTNWRLTQCHAEHTNLATGIRESSNPAIKQSCNPSPWHSPLSNKPMLPVNLQFRFQFQQIFAPKNMPTGIYQLHWYPTGSREFGYELNWDWVWVRGSKPQTVDVFGQYCPQQCVHMHVASCLLLCSALLTSLCKPFICPIIQPEAILFDTHIPQAPRTFRPLCTVCALSAQSGVTQTRTLSWHMQISSCFASPQARTLLLPSHTHTRHTSHLTMLVLPPHQLEKVVSPSALCVCVCYVKRIAAMRHLIHLMP